MMSPATVTIGEQRFPLTLTVLEYQAAFTPQLGRDSIYAAIERGEIPHVKRGRRILILTTPALRDLGYEINSQAEPGNKDETPPAGGVSQVSSLDKDEPGHDHSTSTREQQTPAPDLRAVR